MDNFTDFSIEAILGLKKDRPKPAHVPRCLSQSALLAGPPRHQVRRCRTIFTDNDITKLQRIFEVNQYPDIYLREQLSQEIRIPESRIQVWFQNRRMKSRRNGNSITDTGSTSTSSNRKRKPPAPLTIFGPRDSNMETLSSAEKVPLFQLPGLISPVHPTPLFHTNYYSTFQFAVSPISPLPQTPITSERFTFPDVPHCRSWMDLSQSSVYTTRLADYHDSSSSSAESAVECDDDDDDDGNDNLVIDFDV